MHDLGVGDRSAIERLLEQKKELIRLFLIAAVLAFGVGTLASLFVSEAFVPPWSTVLLCGTLIVLALLFLLKDLFSALVFEDEFDAIVFLDRARNRSIPIEDYRFSESLYATLRAVAAENRALHADWDNAPLVPARDAKPRTQSEKPSYFSIVKVTVDPATNVPPKSVRLLEEAAHFVLLEELSLHLSSYFNDRGDDDYVREMGRDDIPEFLLRNRVLNLLSTPIEQREIFLKAFPDSAKRPDGEIYSVYGSDGSVFSRFDLVLPRGSSVRASADGGITVETRRLSFSMKATYTGSAAVVGRPFIEEYAKLSYDDVATQEMSICLKGKIKTFSLLTNAGWRYYRWLDSFRQRLKTTCDFDTFQTAIGWRLVETVLYTFRHLQLRPGGGPSIATSADDSGIAKEVGPETPPPHASA
jgi:hypothetical protein